MKDINKFYAEKCGVTTRINNIKELCFQTEWGNYTVWTIQDPRCREIIRERFKLDTLLGIRSKSLNTWVCERLSDSGNLICGGKGKTIAEAEIACLTEIYNNER